MIISTSHASHIHYISIHPGTFHTGYTLKIYLSNLKRDSNLISGCYIWLYANIPDCIDNAWEVFLSEAERSQLSLLREHWQFGQDKDSSFHLTSQRFAHSCDIHTSDTTELFPSPSSKSWLGVAFWMGNFIIFSVLYTFPFHRNPLHNNPQQWVIPNSSWEGRTKRWMWNYCHFMKLLIFKVSIVLF